MRAIVRFSLNADKRSILRNQLAAILTGYGFVKHVSKTATYEHADISNAKLKVVMGKFWKQAVKPTNAADIDHVWMYCDNPPQTGKAAKKPKQHK